MITTPSNGFDREMYSKYANGELWDEERGNAC
jgi:hypothetical protein